MRTKAITAAFLALSLTAAFFLLRPRVSVAQSGGEPPPLISQVTVTRSLDQSIYTLESAEERIYLNANETASVHVHLSQANGIVRLRAPEGGLIEGRRTLEFDTTQQGAQQGADISVTFDPGDDTGAFHVEISDDRTSETVAEFWVGPEAPLGRPGPNLTFNGN
jgi:hypothetical protein